MTFTFNGTQIIVWFFAFFRKWELCVLSGWQNALNYIEDVSIHLYLLLQIRTQNPSPADGDDSEDFPLDFTLHLEPDSQDSLACSLATAVELHKDSQSGHQFNSTVECCLQPVSAVPLTELLSLSSRLGEEQRKAP